MLFSEITEKKQNHKKSLVLIGLILGEMKAGMFPCTSKGGRDMKKKRSQLSHCV